jgi:PIN domain nuclease of toxin-antitoxin system
MRFLVDTQSYYWSLCEPAKLSAVATEVLQHPSRTKVLSVASFWEMAIKSALGKLTLPKDLNLLWKEAEAAGRILIANATAVNLFEILLVEFVRG